MGDYEVLTLVGMESTVEYHPAEVLNLTLDCYELRKPHDLNQQKTKFKLYYRIKFFAVQKFMSFWLFIPVREQCLVGSLTGAVAS